jgi:hypothetical protein
VTKFLLVIVILIVTIASSPLDLAAVDPYEVKFILNPNFPDTSRSWKLKAGMRQLLVQDIFPPWDKITSIEIGSKVGIMLFQKKYFKFEGSNYVNFVISISDINKSIPGRENRYKSMIVYPREYGNALGVLAGSSTQNDFRFFWLPQEANKLSWGYADVKHLMKPMDFILVFPAQGKNNVSVTLYTRIIYKGNSLSLPIQGKGNRYHLKDYGFAGKIQSLQVKQTLLLKTLPTLKIKPSAERKITPKEISPEVLKKLAEKANVSISGKATGSKAFLATFYSIALYGPNNFNSFREKKRFDKRGNYTFTGLPKGQYQIKVYADPGKADLPYTLKPPVPSYRVVNCTTGNAVNQDFKFE